jgi:methylmalonyl-CoA epimerase
MAEPSRGANGPGEPAGDGDLVDHVGIVVRDIDASLAFYRGLLGFMPFGDESLPEVGVRVVYLASNQPGSTTLQLVQPTKAGPLKDFLDAEGDGLHHICLAVDDIPAALDRLAPGASVRIVIGGRGRRACFLPELREGLRIELTEIEPWAVRQASQDRRNEEEGR